MQRVGYSRALATAGLVAGAVAFGLALVLAGGCDTGPLFPDMGNGPDSVADLAADPPPTDAAMQSYSASDGPIVQPPMVDASLPGRTLLWHDEFDGPAGQSPDSSNWDFDVSGSGWGNNELEYTTARPSNVSLDGNGHLAIVARAEQYMGKNYTSGRINTLNHFTHAYGRFEARMQMPAGQGMWPAFWLLGDNQPTVGWPACGEIDIVENKGQEPNIVHGTVHGPGYSGANGITAMRTVSGPPLSAGFHTYAIEWLADLVVFSVDGDSYFMLTPSQLPAGTSWVFDHAFGIIFDLAVGGNFVGSPDSTTTFPQTLLVDYVRVYAPMP